MGKSRSEAMYHHAEASLAPSLLCFPLPHCRVFTGQPMAVKSTKQDWNALLQDVKSNARAVREHIESAPATLAGQDPSIAKEFITNARKAYEKLEETGTAIMDVLQCFDGQVPFAGQPLQG